MEGGTTQCRMQMDEMLSSWPKLQRRSWSEDIYTHNCTQLPNSKKHSFHMENTHAEGVPLSKLTVVRDLQISRNLPQHAPIQVRCGFRQLRALLHLGARPSKKKKTRHPEWAPQTHWATCGTSGQKHPAIHGLLHAHSTPVLGARCG